MKIQFVLFLRTYFENSMIFDIFFFFFNNWSNKSGIARKIRAKYFNPARKILQEGETFTELHIYRFLIVYRLPLKWDWNLSCTDCFAYFPFPPFAMPLHQLLIVLIWRACHQSSGVFLRSHWNSFQLLEYSKQSTHFQMVISWKRKELPGSVVGKMTISDFVFFGF